MPSNYRISAAGLLEVFHQDTNTFIPATVPLQVSGGTSVALVESQLDLVREIGAKLEKVQNLDAIGENLNTFKGNSSSQLGLLIARTASVIDVLDGISAKLPDEPVDTVVIQTSLIALRQELNALLEGLTERLEGAIAELESVKAASEAASAVLTAAASGFFPGVLSGISANNAAVSDLTEAMAVLPSSLGSLAGLGATFDEFLPALVASTEALADVGSLQGILDAILSAVNGLLSNAGGSVASKLDAIKNALTLGAPALLGGGAAIDAGMDGASSATFALDPQAIELQVQAYTSVPNATVAFAIELSRESGPAESAKSFLTYNLNTTAISAASQRFPAPVVFAPVKQNLYLKIHLQAVSNGVAYLYVTQLRQNNS